MKMLLKICKRKYVLTAFLCFGFVLAGFSVSGIRAQAGKIMSVGDFTGEVVVEKGTTVLPREGRKVSIYSYPAGGKYLYESVDSWEADHTYYVKEAWHFQAGTDLITLDTMCLDNLTMSQSSLDMVVGQTQSMRDIYIKEPTGANEKINWTSDNESVIKAVNDYGKFQAVSPGSATVTGISEYTKKTVSCTITVTSVPVVGVSLNKETLNLIIGQEETLIATITPSNATDQNLTWSSDRENVAMVSDTGKITAVGVGDAVITVLAGNGTKGATCNVTVTAQPSGGSIEDGTTPGTNQGGAALDEDSGSLSEKVLTDEDRQKINAGQNVKIKLIVENGQDVLTAEEKEALRSALGKNSLGMYLHIALLKTFEGEEDELVSETNGEIGIRLRLPDNLLNTDSSKTRTYSILREHGGEVAILPCTFDPNTKMLSFKTDRFSAYAIIYNDTTNGDDNTGGNNGNTTGGNTGDTNTAADNSGSSVATSTSTAAAVKDEVPKTGESGQAFFWSLLALCAVTGVMCLGKKRITGKK